MLRSLLHRAPSAALIAFAGWTLLAQAMVALGAHLLALEIAALVATLIAAGAGAWWWKRREAGTGSEPMAIEEPGATASQVQRFVFALLCASAIVLAHRATANPGILATGGAALLLLGMIWRGRERDDAQDVGPPRSTAAGVGLLAIALATAALVLVAHNPDPDDAFYLNVAAQAATSPTAPLLAQDGIFGIEDMPIQLPVYRAHSIELLVGVVAHLSGLEPIVVGHLGLVALAGFLVPLVAARLLHRLLPGHAVLGALATVVVLVACGEGELGPGHFSLLRLQQGKGMLLALAIPMLFDAVLAYARTPSRGNWLRLFAAQVAAVGLTSSALFLVPFTSLATLLVVWRYDRVRIRALVFGLLASAHAGIVLLWLGPAMAEQLKLMDALARTSTSTSAGPHIVSSTLQRALGESAWSAILLVAVLSAWAVPRHRDAGRALAGSAFVVFGLLLQPGFATSIADRLLAPDVYFRVLWMVPWAIAATVVLLAPVRLVLRSPAARSTRTFATLLLAMALPLFTTSATVLDEEAKTRVAWPGPKVPEPEYEAARWLAENTPPRSPVLAALDVAPWVSTFRSMPHPLYSRLIYHRYLQLGLPDEEVDQRRTLAGFVSFRGPHLERTDVLCHHAETRDLRGIAMRRFGARTDAQLEHLASCGFRRAGRNELYEVWVRDTP